MVFLLPGHSWRRSCAGPFSQLAAAQSVDANRCVGKSGILPHQHRPGCGVLLPPRSLQLPVYLLILTYSQGAPPQSGVVKLTLLLLTYVTCCGTDCVLLCHVENGQTYHWTAAQQQSSDKSVHLPTWQHTSYCLHACCCVMHMHMWDSKYAMQRMQTRIQGETTSTRKGLPLAGERRTEAKRACVCVSKYALRT